MERLEENDASLVLQELHLETFAEKYKLTSNDTSMLIIMLVSMLIICLCLFLKPSARGIVHDVELCCWFSAHARVHIDTLLSTFLHE